MFIKEDPEEYLYTQSFILKKLNFDFIVRNKGTRYVFDFA